MLRVNELKEKLNYTDDKGNQLKFDGKNLKILSEGTTRDIGWLEMVDGKGLTYRKKEREQDRYRKTDAWSIPAVILEEVTHIQYQSDARAYEIAVNIAFLYGKKIKSKPNLEEKVYVPVDKWTIFKSMDAKEQARIEMFGIEWYNKLHKFIWSDTMTDLSIFLAERMKVNKVYPEFKHLFKAFATTPLSKVRVVFIGNEPIQEEICNGIAYYVGLPFYDSIEIKNIQDELEREGDDYMINFNPKHVFDSTTWAEQGCLMINQCLSVEKGHLMTHEGRGWEELITNVVCELNKQERPICFVLMGTRAYGFDQYIDSNYHTVIRTDVTSSKFIGSNLFWEVDGFMNNNYNTKINW